MKQQAVSLWIISFFASIFLQLSIFSPASLAVYVSSYAPNPCFFAHEINFTFTRKITNKGKSFQEIRKLKGTFE